MSALAGAGDIQTMPEYYVEYQELVPDILAKFFTVTSECSYGIRGSI
jgi:hypothetical protein